MKRIQPGQKSHNLFSLFVRVCGGKIFILSGDNSLHSARQIYNADKVLLRATFVDTSYYCGEVEIEKFMACSNY